MSTITTVISPFTKSPSRSNPTTFSADMDSRLSEENSRIVEMNAVSSEMNIVSGEVNTNATTATTQAGISTAQAVISTAQAVISTTKAGEASTSASNALASENAAALSESNALASEIAAAASALSVDPLNLVHRDNTDETKLGSLTIGESISITSWSFVGTDISLVTEPNNSKSGDSISVSGLTGTTNLPNGTWVATTVDSTHINFTALLTPVGTPTVSGALVNYGDFDVKGGFNLNQTRRNVTAERALGVNYLNDTNKTKEVTVVSDQIASNAQTLEVYIDDILIQNQFFAYATNQTGFTACFDVLPNEEYRIQMTNISLFKWTEK